MGKDISLKPHCIKDKIVVDAIKSISSLAQSTPGHITGGMAVQSYLPDPNRKTVDLDI